MSGLLKGVPKGALIQEAADTETILIGDIYQVLHTCKKTIIGISNPEEYCTASYDSSPDFFQKFKRYFQLSVTDNVNFGDRR